MQVRIPYEPHRKQLEIHNDPSRFKVIAAGRRFGKTVLLINEMIKQALTHPQLPGLPVQRSWYVANTYKMAETIAWRVALQYLPAELIASKNVAKLTIELVNGHILEFKGAEDPDRLRGVGLVWVGIDEYGFMREDVWTDILRQALLQSEGGAMFIGTPGPDGSPHFYEIFLKGQREEDGFKSWMGFTVDNPIVPRHEIENARRTLPPEIFKREYEADFTITAGLIYDNFKPAIHLVPNYVPHDTDLVVGSIDPGLHNPCGALFTAWTKDGEGVIFNEYYQKEKLATENALAIREKADAYKHKFAYWVIDRSSIRRDPASGLSVFGKFQEVLCPQDRSKWTPSCAPLITAPNDPGSVWAGIDEVKKLLNVDPVLNRPKLFVSKLCHYWLWEQQRYTRYKRKWHAEKNEEEKPRKLHDHLMDCTKNMVLTKPWVRGQIRLRRNEGPYY